MIAINDWFISFVDLINQIETQIGSFLQFLYPNSINFTPLTSNCESDDVFPSTSCEVTLGTRLGFAGLDQIAYSVEFGCIPGSQVIVMPLGSIASGEGLGSTM